MKAFFSHLYYLFMNLKISWKLFIGYLIVVLLPTLGMDYFLYQSNYRSILQSYLINEQTALNNSAQTFALRLSQTEGLTKLLEGNPSIQDYLNGYYTDLSDAVYDYMSNITPVLQQFSSRNYISDFAIYVFRDYVLNIRSYFPSVENLKNRTEILNLIEHNVNGSWRVEPYDDSSYSLVYYKPMFDTNYTNIIGIIRLEIDSENYLNPLFSESSSGKSFYIEDTSTGKTYQFQNSVLQSSEFEAAPRLTVQTSRPEGVSFCFIQLLDISRTLNYHVTSIIPIFFVILCILTLLYYMIARSISQRLLSLTKYISTADIENLKPYETSSFRDEIGILIDAVNGMIERINHLIHENYQAELSRKDAEYYALQAQIKPHFLYNILENIRMKAEIDHAPQTADMLLSLGKFMRYNLNSSMKKASLSDELESARNYLSLYHLRQEGQLFYEIAACTEIDNIFCPRFILQPLLENSIKHGGQDGTPLHISILIEDDPLQNDCVQIRITDDGIGMEQAQLQALNQNLENNMMDGNSHVGLYNVNSRLTAYKGSQGHLTIQSASPRGCCISFRLKRERRFYEN